MPRPRDRRALSNYLQLFKPNQLSQRVEQLIELNLLSKIDASWRRVIRHLLSCRLPTPTRKKRQLADIAADWAIRCGTSHRGCQRRRLRPRSWRRQPSRLFRDPPGVWGFRQSSTTWTCPGARPGQFFFPGGRRTLTWIGCVRARAGPPFENESRHAFREQSPSVRTSVMRVANVITLFASALAARLSRNICASACFQRWARAAA